MWSLMANTFLEVKKAINYHEQSNERRMAQDLYEKKVDSRVSFCTPFFKDLGQCCLQFELLSVTSMRYIFWRVWKIGKIMECFTYYYYVKFARTSHPDTFRTLMSHILWGILLTLFTKCDQSKICPSYICFCMKPMMTVNLERDVKFVVYW